MSAGRDAQFRALHQSGRPFVLGNAWDAVSASVLERAGFAAIGTTSAGVAASLGRPDNEQLPADELCAAIERMVQATRRPLSVDIETGYFDVGARFDAFIGRLLDTGISGLNLQDALGTAGPLQPAADVARRIERVRTLAERRHADTFVNARTDAFWVATSPGDAAVRTALERLQSYREAGADGAFVPGLRARLQVEVIVAACGMPLNLLAWPGMPGLPTLGAWGVARVSLGSGLLRALLGYLETLGSRLRDGDFAPLGEAGLDYAGLDALYATAAPVSS